MNTDELESATYGAERRVLEIQAKLHRWARDDPHRRFDDLFNLVADPAFLLVAWDRVRGNKGAKTAGVDGATASSVALRTGVEEFLDGLRASIKDRSFRPLPVRERTIPKAGGKLRRLGIATITDRVVQASLKLVLEPIFEADFLECSYGFRPKRSATQALEAIREAGNRGYNFVLDADIKGYFDNIQRTTLMELVKERISDRRVLKLIRQWLAAGVMEDGTVRETLAGTPQGGVISPLLANIYLNYLDRIWQSRCSQIGMLVRYCDDFVVMCQRESQAREALRRVGLVMQRLGLELHPEKTRMVDLRRGREGFVFLGCTVRKKRSIQRNPRWHFMQRWPSPKAMKRIRERVREMTDARQSGQDVKQIIAKLTPVLRGWGNYFRSGNADRKFNQLDQYVFACLVRWRYRRGGQRKGRVEKWTHDRLVSMGLYRLRTTVKYPAQATPVRSSLSRVRENRTHGLKGVC